VRLSHDPPASYNALTYTPNLQLAGEVKTLMKEVGDLREAKRALQQCVTSMSPRLHHSPSADFFASCSTTARLPTFSSSRPGTVQAMA
jgi:hypothetical protein